MNALVKTLLLGAMGAVALGASAHAADIIEPPYEPAPEIVPVEIGSGWYLRGDVSYDFETDTKGDYRTFGACDAGGCDPAIPTYATSDYDKWTIDSGVDFGVGAGYQFNDFLRGDLTAHYWQHDVHGSDRGNDCGGLCGSEEKGEASAWELMANAYVDLGNFGGLTPYVGAGLGGVHVKYDDFSSTNHASDGTVSYDTIYGNDDWRFAYALMAGVSYDLTDALKLDVGYRYVDVDEGDIFSKNKAGGVVGGTDDGFDRHTIQAGLRYSLF